jgi:hypothetical protein
MRDEENKKRRAFDALFSVPYKIQSISPYGVVDIKFIKKV